jgi:hypothetical protein
MQLVVDNQLCSTCTDAPMRYTCACVRTTAPASPPMHHTHAHAHTHRRSTFFYLWWGQVVLQVLPGAWLLLWPVRFVSRRSVDPGRNRTVTTPDLALCSSLMIVANPRVRVLRVAWPCAVRWGT